MKLLRKLIYFLYYVYLVYSLCMIYYNMNVKEDFCIKKIKEYIKK